jgi:geranylgeranyl diphosphate synthase type I
MHQVVDSAPEAAEFNTMLRYPLGWVDKDGKPYDQSTGKRIRPILLLLCAEATGGKDGWQQAIPAATAVELLHNFSLIHDDIQDNSETRHNRPTVWKVWGQANAINAGDAMFALSYAALSRLTERNVSPEIALKCWAIFNRTNLELTRGQHLDMRFEKQEMVQIEEYLSMTGGKSAALVAASAQMGALIGSRDDTIAAHFYDFGHNLGVAFQIHDDILGIWGDPSVTGKSAATDIISRKKSLPILYGLSKSKSLAAIYRRKKFQQSDVADAVEELNLIGALEYTRHSESKYYEKALDSLQLAAKGQTSTISDLIALSEFLFERQK